MLNEDNVEYYKYTGPQRFDKAIHTLEGIVRGIAIDDKVNDSELSVLTGWIAAHREFADRHPFNEVIPRLHQILADGIIDDEEKADILWLCNKFTTDDTYYCHVTADMHRLQGILGGIVADGKITKEEIKALQDWMDAHEHLRTCWPYDELEALIVAVLQDGVIAEAEHRGLLQFFGEFTELPGHHALELPKSEEPTLVTGVCAVCPEIVFAGRCFCFTGRSEKYSRQAFADEITQRGGVFSKSLTKNTDYLTIGGDGNPCWAYACYGRKVEQAIQYRKEGCRILLVHEYDLWDALEDTQ
jgi:hypothetical protein